MCVSLLIGTFSTKAVAALMSVSSSGSIAAQVNDWSLNLFFPKFDPLLGTLVSFQLDLSSTLNATLTIQNTSGSASQGTARAEVQLSVKDPLSLMATPQLVFQSPIYQYGLANNTSSTSSALSATANNSTPYTLPALLTEFTGSGNIKLTFSTFTQGLITNTPGGGNSVIADLLSSANVNSTLTYNFTPAAVPEPGTAVFGIACIGIAAIRRRRTA